MKAIKTAKNQLLQIRYNTVKLGTIMLENKPVSRNRHQIIVQVSKTGFEQKTRKNLVKENIPHCGMI